MAERPNALALKASVPRGTGGSNPSASASLASGNAAGGGRGCARPERGGCLQEGRGSHWGPNTPVADPANEPWPGGNLAQLATLGIFIIRVEESVQARMPTPPTNTAPSTSPKASPSSSSPAACSPAPKATANPSKQPPSSSRPTPQHSTTRSTWSERRGATNVARAWGLCSVAARPGGHHQERRDEKAHARRWAGLREGANRATLRYTGVRRALPPTFTRATTPRQERQIPGIFRPGSTCPS